MKSFSAMVKRMGTLPPRHCIVCMKKARRVYARISHTETVICTKRCWDEWDAAVGRVEVKPNNSLTVGGTPYRAGTGSEVTP